MRGQSIICSADPKGKWISGVIVGTPSPGTMMEMDPTVASLKDGLHSYRVFQRGSDGQRAVPLILLEDDLFGKGPTDAYVAGTIGRMYVPMAGETMNILLADIVGTGDAHALGEYEIHKSGTGKFIATTGSPQSEPFRLLEAIAAPIADTLAWSMATGL